MAPSPGDKTEPSLELPSLRLPGRGRKRRKQAADGPTGTTDAPVEPVEEPTRHIEADVVREPVAPEPEAEPAPQPAPPRRERTRRTRPLVPGSLAAALTGAVVGAAGAAGTYGAMAGCEAVRGVSSCGGAPGFFILVAIVVLMVLLGAGLLKAFRAADAVSTSFLAVGVVTVLVMLVLLEVIFSVWMFAVIPALTAASFLVARWVTTRFEGEDTGRRDWR